MFAIASRAALGVTFLLPVVAGGCAEWPEARGTHAGTRSASDKNEVREPGVGIDDPADGDVDAGIERPTGQDASREAANDAGASESSMRLPRDSSVAAGNCATPASAGCGLAIEAGGSPSLIGTVATYCAMPPADAGMLSKGPLAQEAIGPNGMGLNWDLVPDYIPVAAPVCVNCYISKYDLYCDTSAGPKAIVDATLDRTVGYLLPGGIFVPVAEMVED